MIIHILLIDFHAVAHPAGKRTMDGFHVLWSMLLVYTKSRKEHISGAHGLHSGIILETNVAAVCALWMHGGITIVIFERICVRVGPTTHTAGEGS